MRLSDLCLPMACLVVGGCTTLPDAVSVRGLVTATHGSETPLSGAEVAILDEQGAEYDRGTTSETGSFTAEAPAGMTIFAEVSASGFTTASFTGTSGVEPALYVERGVLHGMSDEAVGEWRTLFAGCEGSEAGGFVVGVATLLGATELDSGEPVTVDTAYASVLTADGQTLQGCYLDAEGTLADPEAIVSGETGTFAVFGVPEGVHQLTVGYELGGSPVYEVTWPMWMPADGVVPRFPVELELVH